jgi:hypothetical protein
VYLLQLVQLGLDEGMLIGMDDAIMAVVDDPDTIRREGAVTQASQRPVDGLGAVQFPHPRKIDLTPEEGR